MMRLMFLFMLMLMMIFVMWTNIIEAWSALFFSAWRSVRRKPGFFSLKAAEKRGKCFLCADSRGRIFVSEYDEKTGKFQAEGVLWWKIIRIPAGCIKKEVL